MLKDNKVATHNTYLALVEHIVKARKESSTNTDIIFSTLVICVLPINSLLFLFDFDLDSLLQMSVQNSEFLKWHTVALLIF